jgi:hypothetical protein
MTVDNNPRREDLLRAADEARTKLLRAVVVLDQRRHHALDVPKQVMRQLRRFALVGTVLVVGTAGVTTLALHRVTARRDRRALRRRARWGLAWRVLRRPDQEISVRRRERRSFAVEVLRSLLLTVVTSALAAPLRRVVHGTFDR